MSWHRELGLCCNPFDLPVQGPDDVFETADLNATQQAILECVLQRQLLIIKGPAGGGKTTAVYDMLAEGVKSRGRSLLLVRDFTLTYEQLRIGHIVEALIKAILEATGGTEGIKRSANGRYYQLQRLLGQYAAGHEVVLVLEDGHALPPQLLVNLKRLREMRFAMQERLLSIIILAHPQIDNTLLETREVRLRTEILELQGFTSEEVEQYIAFRLAKAGKTPGELLTKEAIKIICGAVRWPQEINRVMTDLLKQGVEVGDVPISEALAVKYCGTMSSLASLKMMSGITVPEIRSRLAGEYGIKADRYVIRRALSGADIKQSGVRDAIRNILAPLAAGQSAMMDEIRTRLTGRQRERLEKVQLMLAEFDYEYDWTQLAAACKMRPGRFHEIVFVGHDPTDGELMTIEREVKKAHTVKRNARESRAA